MERKMEGKSHRELCLSVIKKKLHITKTKNSDSLKRRIRPAQSLLALKAIENNNLIYLKQSLPYIPRLDEEIKEERDLPSTTLLCRACSLGSLPIIKELVKSGANVNSYAQFNRPPLEIAIQNNDKDTVEYLLDNGAMAVTKTFSALHVAAAAGQSKFICILLKRKIQINLVDKDGDTALHVAVKNRRLNICHILIINKCDMNIQNKVGNTPLHEAYSKADLNKQTWRDIVKLLLECKAKTNIRNNNGLLATEMNQFKKYVDFSCANSEKTKAFTHNTGWPKIKANKTKINSSSDQRELRHDYQYKDILENENISEYFHDSKMSNLKSLEARIDNLNLEIKHLEDQLEFTKSIRPTSLQYPFNLRKRISRFEEELTNKTAMKKMLVSNLSQLSNRKGLFTLGVANFFFKWCY